MKPLEYDSGKLTELEKDCICRHINFMTYKKMCEGMNRSIYDNHMLHYYNLLRLQDDKPGEMMLGFGKYRHIRLKNIRNSYFVWLIKENVLQNDLVLKEGVKKMIEKYNSQ